MADNIFDQLRGRIEEQQRTVHDAQTSCNGTPQDAEMREHLKRIQYFRVNIFPIIHDFLRTVIALQCEKIRVAQMSDIVDITYPLAGKQQTRYGFSIPQQIARNPLIRLEQVLLTATLPSKPSKHYVWTIRIKAVDSVIETEIHVYDELARRAGNMDSYSAKIDSKSEFKEGELLVIVKGLVDRAIELCVADMSI